MGQIKYFLIFHPFILFKSLRCGGIPKTYYKATATKICGLLSPLECQEAQESPSQTILAKLHN